MKLHESLPAPPDYKILVLEDLSAEPGGFLRRVSRRVCTVDVAGTRSRPLVYDEVDRSALDAVVVVPHFMALNAQGEREVFVVLRSAIRPPLALRDSSRSPVAELDNRGLWEVPAGLVEQDERGESGLRRAAIRELWEETGFVVEPARVHGLGSSTLPAPGVIAERQFFFHVEVDPDKQEPPALDGSPLEEAGEVIFVTLRSCLAAARAGQLADAKTELALRRLAELGSVASGGSP